MPALPASFCFRSDSALVSLHPAHTTLIIAHLSIFWHESYACAGKSIGESRSRSIATENMKLKREREFMLMTWSIGRRSRCADRAGFRAAGAEPVERLDAACATWRPWPADKRLFAPWRLGIPSIVIRSDESRGGNDNRPLEACPSIHSALGSVVRARDHRPRAPPRWEKRATATGIERVALHSACWMR